MKVLLDENIPRKLKYRFSEEFEIITVPEMGWSGIKNGRRKYFCFNKSRQKYE